MDSVKYVLRSRCRDSVKYAVDEERDRRKERFIDLSRAKPGAGSASKKIE